MSLMPCTLDGGSIDPDMNATLAAALKAARAAGVPKDNIERAMNKVCCCEY